MHHKLSIAATLLLGGLAYPSAGRADFLYGGMATGAFATVEVTFLIGSTGPLPREGGIREVYLASSSSPVGLATGPISGITLGIAGLATADVTVNDLSLTFGGNTITAQRVGGHVTADGHTGGLPEVGGFSDFLSLMVNGTAVTVTGAPNQQIDLPNNMRLVLNEQIPSSQGTAGMITLNALHLYGGPIVDFRIASVQASIDGAAGPVPEPSAFALLGVGLVGLVSLRWVTWCRELSRAAGLFPRARISETSLKR